MSLQESTLGAENHRKHTLSVEKKILLLLLSLSNFVTHKKCIVLGNAF